MRLPRRAERLTIYVSQLAQHKGVPTYVHLVERARRAGLAGATVLQSQEGFGNSSKVHASRPFSVEDDVPLVIILIDTTENLDRFLAEVGPLLQSEGTLTRQSVEVILQSGEPPEAVPDSYGHR